MGFLIALCAVASAGDRIVVMTGDDLSSALELSLSGRQSRRPRAL